jgi:hypothetical protein
MFYPVNAEFLILGVFLSQFKSGMGYIDGVDREARPRQE